MRDELEVGELPNKSLPIPLGYFEYGSPGTQNKYPVELVSCPRVNCTRPYCDYDFFVLRRAFAALLLRARALRILVRFLTTAFAARRTRGLAPATFSVNAFCTDPAFAAMVPSVAPMDSATLVRIASSFPVLRLSMPNPISRTSASRRCVSHRAATIF